MRAVPLPTGQLSSILSRLQRVQQHGHGYRANCPRGHSSRGALSLSEGDDGRVMLHCFAGCSAADVVGVLGLTLADLYPQGDIRNLSPLERARRRELTGIASWRSALGVLSTEATIIEVAASLIERGEPLTSEDTERVRLAAERIHDAREVLR